MTEDEVRDLIKKKMGYRGGRRLAAATGLSSPMISQALSGKRRLCQKLLDWAGVEKVTQPQKYRLRQNSKVV